MGRESRFKMIHILLQKKRILFKIKYHFFMHKGLTRVPSENSVTSDLFPIPPIENWTTDFELLNLDELALGNFDRQKKKSVFIYFFDQFGRIMGIREVFQDNFAKLQIRISDYLKEELKSSTSFSVFHQCNTTDINKSGSFLAERGYCGYAYKGTRMKGYVHGNLDAVAFNNGRVSPIGNSGFWNRDYIVQHPLIGPAEYYFVITNPTNKAVKIATFLWRQDKWVKDKLIFLPPLGSHNMVIKLARSEKILIKLRSRLYLCRPVIFRVNKTSMDVFHG